MSHQPWIPHLRYGISPAGSRYAHAHKAAQLWSGRRESNPRPTAWKAVTLPLSYSRLNSRPRAVPTGLDSNFRSYPGLTPWANFSSTPAGFGHQRFRPSPEATTLGLARQNFNHLSPKANPSKPIGLRFGAGLVASGSRLTRRDLRAARAPASYSRTRYEPRTWPRSPPSQI